MIAPLDALLYFPVGFGGSEVTFEGAEVTFGATATAFGDGETEVDGRETETDPALLAGITGDVCFIGPPTTLDLLFGPPTAFCANAGLANAQSTRTDMTAPLFIDDPLQVMPAAEDNSQPHER